MRWHDYGWTYGYGVGLAFRISRLHIRASGFRLSGRSTGDGDGYGLVGYMHLYVELETRGVAFCRLFFHLALVDASSHGNAGINRWPGPSTCVFIIAFDVSELGAFVKRASPRRFGFRPSDTRHPEE
jgi:hypothetical protein